MDNPITEDHNGSRKFYLEYDMSQFKPEEITVKTSGRELIVFAKHEEVILLSSTDGWHGNIFLPPVLQSEIIGSILRDILPESVGVQLFILVEAQ
jgi:hypothetical protein